MACTIGLSKHAAAFVAAWSCNKEGKYVVLARPTTKVPRDSVATDGSTQRPHRMLLTALVLALTFGSATAVLADTLVSRQMYYQNSGGQCFENYAEIREYPGYSGYTKSFIQSFNYVLTFGCSGTKSLAANNLRNGHSTFLWTGSSWVACSAYQLVSNSGSTSIQRTERYWSSPPCGAGYYYARSYSEGKYGGVWYPDEEVTPSHWLS
jgi:hypothetical protein